MESISKKDVQEIIDKLKKKVNNPDKKTEHLQSVLDKAEKFKKALEGDTETLIELGKKYLGQKG